MNDLDDKYARVLRWRLAASQLLLLFFSFGVVYAESDALTDWRPQVLSSTFAIVLFVLSNMAPVLSPDNEKAASRFSFWTQAALVVYLFSTAARMELMHLFAVYWVARLPAIFRWRSGILLASAVILLSQLIGWARGQTWEIERLVVMIPFYALVLFVSQMADRERRLHGATFLLNRELEKAQQQLAEVSAQNERLRIARDMHDILGHQLTAQILILEVATHHAHGTAEPHVQQSLALARMMLSDLRNAVREVREPPVSEFSDALRTLLNRVPNLAVTVELPEGVVINNSATAATILRCIQEAATNTLRHSRATHLHLSFVVHTDNVVVTISDNGMCAPDITPGNGLAGMRERIAEIDGTLHWTTHRGNFELEVSIPRHRCAMA